MTHKEAFNFVQSIQSLSTDLFNSLNKLDWKDFADTLSLIYDDVERLTEYANARLIEKESK